MSSRFCSWNLSMVWADVDAISAYSRFHAIGNAAGGGWNDGLRSD